MFEAATGYTPSQWIARALSYAFSHPNVSEIHLDNFWLFYKPNPFSIWLPLACRREFMKTNRTRFLLAILGILAGMLLRELYVFFFR